MLEEQGGSPVVGEVFGHLAGGAAGSGTNIACHGNVESIATNDVVKMSGRYCVRLDHGVKPLEEQCRTWEA